MQFLSCKYDTWINKTIKLVFHHSQETNNTQAIIQKKIWHARIRLLADPYNVISFSLLYLGQEKSLCKPPLHPLFSIVVFSYTVLFTRTSSIFNTGSSRLIKPARVCVLYFICTSTMIIYTLMCSYIIRNVVNTVR